mgnify:FL=1
MLYQNRKELCVISEHEGIVCCIRTGRNYVLYQNRKELCVVSEHEPNQQNNTHDNSDHYVNVTIFKPKLCRHCGIHCLHES